MTDRADTYADRPCYGELVAVVLTGAVHVLSELWLSATISRLFNAGASIVFLAYVVWRVRRTEGVLRAWGMRRDNLRPALLAQMGFTVVGALALVGVGAVWGSLRVPATFWLTLALYPVWSVAQQFALQNLVARNLAGVVRNPVALAVSASALFAASHYPEVELVLLTVVAGVFFTLIYRRFPNLWAVGIAHAILGSLAVHLVLEQDPGAAILQFLTGRL